jgi:hypothetical protein
MQVLFDDSYGDGFNPGIFDTVIPTAAHVHRVATQNAQIKELPQTGWQSFLGLATSVNSSLMETIGY